ncbi:thioredoxin [Campylobacter ureolyticus]|uniref:TlpA family protein disulfide reductase n=1 Tax=Campylobacter ureolyticus TaxID=827 RepID=UPI001FC84C1D|nr:TlpA family protein disulfide reductase [Campylobacter ureolyticus]GKH60308.1 thioredoxin [Campylobacter ureolyticus]
MKKYLLALLTAFLIFGCSSEKEQKQENISISQNKSYFKVGEKITLKNILGKEVTIVRTQKGFKLDGENKLLMIDIFGTFCKPCQTEAPHLMDFQLNNKDDFMMIGLIHFEEVSDEYIMENFAKKYNAYYFIANSDKNPNEEIINQILSDLNYQRSLTVPFKVMYNQNGELEKLSNFNNPAGEYYYNGAISTSVLKDDFERINNARSKN